MLVEVYRSTFSFSNDCAVKLSSPRFLINDRHSKSYPMASKSLPNASAAAAAASTAAVAFSSSVKGSGFSVFDVPFVSTLPSPASPLLSTDFGHTGILCLTRFPLVSILASDKDTISSNSLLEKLRGLISLISLSRITAFELVP